MSLSSKIKSYFKNKAMTFTQAMNYTKAMQEPGVMEEEAKEHSKDMPITQADFHSRRRYLLYCISLCPSPKYRAVLTLLKIYGMTYTDIAQWLQQKGFGTTTVKDVIQAEKDGLSYVREAIARTKDKKVPIMGGLN